MDNPTTEQTTIPTTDTPVSEVPAVPGNDAGGVSGVEQLPAETSAESASPSESAEVPNDGAPVAAVPESDTTPVETASGPAGESNSGASSASVAADPLHTQVAPHLEAIYQLAKDHAEAKPALFAEVKAHTGDLLHKIHNGMATAEGEFVAKLEALLHLL